MSDEELIDSIRQGDEAAAEELIRRYYPSILRYCRYRCGDRQTAEDLTQETFLRLFQYLPSYKNEGRLKAYLFSIANRLCDNEYKNKPLLSLQGEQQTGPSPDAFRQIEDRDEIRRLLERLPPGQQEAVILRFWEGLSFPDIAKVTGCSTWTAQGRVRWALKKMRKEIGHER